MRQKEGKIEFEDFLHEGYIVFVYTIKDRSRDRPRPIYIYRSLSSCLQKVLILLSSFRNITCVIIPPDGQTLPMTRRQSLSPDGTLTVKGVDRTIDQGWYRCIASSKQGVSDRGIQLNVVGKYNYSLSILLLHIP
jgi:hypothetical protein